MNEGDVILVNMYFDDDIFPFRFRYRGKDFVRTRLGKINCFKISPVVQVGRMFKTQDDLTIWFSDDVSHIPVLVKMDIRIVGAVVLKLIKCENTVSQIDIQE